MSTVRERLWLTSGGSERRAWLCCFRDDRGRRRYRQFEARADAVAFMERRAERMLARVDAHVAEIRKLIPPSLPRAAPAKVKPPEFWDDAREKRLAEDLRKHLTEAEREKFIAKAVNAMGGGSYWLRLRDPGGRVLKMPRSVIWHLIQASPQQLDLLE